MLTAYDLEDAKEAGMQAGIDMYLSKPFFRASLERVVAQVLDGDDEAAAGTPAEQKEISLTGLRVLAAEDKQSPQLLSWTPEFPCTRPHRRPRPTSG